MSSGSTTSEMSALLAWTCWLTGEHVSTCQGPPYASVMKPCRSGRAGAAMERPPPRSCSPDISAHWLQPPACRTRAAETQGEPWRNIVAQTSTPQPLPPHTPTASPSPETVVAVEELGRRNGEYLSTPQQEQLRHILRLRHIFCGHFCSTRGGLYKDSSGAV